MDIAGVPHRVARQLPDVAEVEVVVVAGQLTQAAHQLVRLGQVVVKSHAPVISIHRPHKAKALLDTIEIFLGLVTAGGFVPKESEANNLLVCSSLESIPATGCVRELERIVFLNIEQSSAAVTIQQGERFLIFLESYVRKKYHYSYSDH